MGQITSCMTSFDGFVWNPQPTVPTGTSVCFGSTASKMTFITHNIDIEYDPLQNKFIFYSNTYPSISFANAGDAAFWGFDARNGLTYQFVNGRITSPWTLTQSGWISGFLPPSTSTYDDSVAHKLCKDVRVLVGKQTIKEYSGEYIELQNDLLVPYENKAILKLMNGTLDQTQATVAREYYVNLPLGTKEVPLCALTHQSMSVEVDFDSYLNLSQNLNQGTGDFLDAKSYTTYDASTGLLNGQPVNVQTTFSYQQYIFIVTYGGQFIVYDTTKNVDDPASYIVLSAFSGTSLFSQFCVLSGNLYIVLSNGNLARMIISELIQGNISSFVVNNYVPEVGSPTGTIVADARYLYYTQSNLTSNVIMVRYDTQGLFTNSGNYTSFNFTSNIDSTATSVYQILSTGNQLIALTNTSGKFYVFNLNGIFTSDWNSVDYLTHGTQITEGVLIGTSLYFIADRYKIIVYKENVFIQTIYTYFNHFIGLGGALTQGLRTSSDGIVWYGSNAVIGPFEKCIYGNGTFVATAVGYFAAVMTSTNGFDWTQQIPFNTNLYWIVYGNGIFITLYTNTTDVVISRDNAVTWTAYNVNHIGDMITEITYVIYGNGFFVGFSHNNAGAQISATSINGIDWTAGVTELSSLILDITQAFVAFGNDVFIALSGGLVESRIYYVSSAYISSDGLNWTTVSIPNVNLNFFTFANGSFIGINYDSSFSLTSPDGINWSINSISIPYGLWNGLTYGNGNYFIHAIDGPAIGLPDLVRSVDGITWTVVDGIFPQHCYAITFGDGQSLLPWENNQLGDGIKNIHAVGSKIYASSNSSTVSSVFEIDTSKDLNSTGAYKYYSSTVSTAPITFDGTAPKIFANGPRYVYMFTQDPSGTTNPVNVSRFDPYGPDTTFKASILVDYESLPPEVPKPDKALLGLVQTQKVTDMNYMNIKGPVKELWVTGASATTNVFQYSNLAPRSSLALTGEKIVTEDEGTHTFLNIIEPFETHTSMPIRNVSVVAFELDPESEIPNGTINFSRIRDQIFEGGAQTVWARNYNLLKIQEGLGGLMFN